jgi:general secretion pathway protein D
LKNPGISLNICCRLLLLLAVVTVGGCENLMRKYEKKAQPVTEESATEMVRFSDVGSEKKPVPATPEGEAEAGDEGEQTGLFPGTGRFVKPGKKGPLPQPTASVAGDISLNFENTDIREVVKVILGDVLKVNYILDPGVRGGVTMLTGRPLSQDALLPTLETLLRMNGAAMVLADDAYLVVPVAKAVRGTMVPQLADAATPLPSGYSLQVVPLKYIAAAEMQKILQPLVVEGSVIRVDALRNLLVIAGNGVELSYILETVRTFDVDWLAGLSVGFFELKYSKTSDVMTDLQSILGVSGEEKGGVGDLIRVLPIEGVNGLLVVTPRPEYLKRVARWVERLDRIGGAGGAEERLYVYPVLNGDAKNLAELLNELYTTEGVEVKKSASLAPGLTPKRLESSAAEAGDRVAEGATTEVAATSTSVGRPSSKVRIVADEANNNLLIMTTARDYQKIEGMLKKLDIVPLQVHIEATIIEILLSDELEYGIQWFFKNNLDGGYQGEGVLDGVIDDAKTSGLGTLFPGFSWSLIDSTNNIRFVLNAFAGDSRVNVLSAPSVMVLDNYEARIQVGDQVPIATQQQQSTSGVSTVVNSIEYRDTGITLTVKPKVNPGGLVTMEIVQEVSNAVETQSSSLDSPTIQTRIISTEWSGRGPGRADSQRDPGGAGRSSRAL